MHYKLYTREVICFEAPAEFLDLFHRILCHLIKEGERLGAWVEVYGALRRSNTIRMKTHFAMEFVDAKTREEIERPEDSGVAAPVFMLGEAEKFGDTNRYLYMPVVYGLLVSNE